MMKKKLLLMIAGLGIALQAAAMMPAKLNQEKLFSLISSYKRHDGFEVVQMGSVKTAALKMALRIALRFEKVPEAEAALDIMKGVRRLSVVDYSDCAKAVRASFESELERMLAKGDLIMEARDGNDMIRIYGVVSDSGEQLKDFVVYSPDNSALICIFGSVDVKDLRKLAR